MVLEKGLTIGRNPGSLSFNAPLVDLAEIF
jgi:hypothetical protein